MDVAPDGRAFYSGPDHDAAHARHRPAPARGRRSVSATRSTATTAATRCSTSARCSSPAAARRRTTRGSIDINGATPQVTATAPMAFGRRQHNLTVLADGSVLATGGNSSGAGLVDLNNGVYAAELWNPATGQWTTLAAMQVTRQYHSTALLLPDGRVLSSGGGICGTCDEVGYLAKNAQVFSPPYLFQADGTPGAAARDRFRADLDRPTARRSTSRRRTRRRSRKVALVRLGAVTHSVNMEQRYVPLTFTRRRDEPDRDRARRTPTSRRPATTCCSSSTPTACRRSRSMISVRAARGTDRHAHPAGQRRDASPHRRRSPRGDGERLGRRR